MKKKSRPPLDAEQRPEGPSHGGGRASFKLKMFLWMLRRWLSSKEGKEMLEKLKGLGAGYRTYGIVAIFIACVAAEKLLGWDIPGFDVQSDWLQYILGALGLGTLRASVSSAK